MKRSVAKGFILIFLFVAFSIQAQPVIPEKKFYAGIETGPAFLMLSRNHEKADRTARFALGFFGGYIPLPLLRLGISLNGTLIESFGDFYTSPEKGISISNFHAVLQVFPIKNSGFFVNLQGGRSVYVNHHPDNYNAAGFSGKTGLGYELKTGHRTRVSIVMNYGSGKFRDLHYPGVSITDQHFSTYEISAVFIYR
jgi:hypothetical protein